MFTHANHIIVKCKSFRELWCNLYLSLNNFQQHRHTVVQQKSEIDSKLCEILKQLQHIQDTQN